MARAFDAKEKTIIDERLLDAAEHLFGRYGLRKTRVEEITREAGISKGSFYRFYESKELLCFAVIERVQSRQREAMRDLAAQGGAPADRLERVIRFGLRVLEETPVLRMMTEQEEYAQLVRGVPVDRLEGEFRDDELFLRSLLADIGGDLSVEPEVATGLIRSVFFVAMSSGRIAPGSEDRLLDALIGILARGLFHKEGTS
jgi:AcrR family transcriptional regulator